MLVECDTSFRLIRGKHGIHRVIHMKIGGDISTCPIWFINDPIKFDLAFRLFNMKLNALLIFYLTKNFFGIKTQEKKSDEKQVLGSVHRSGHKKLFTSTGKGELGCANYADFC